MDAHNIVLTGLPRGGTTLVCYLLNKLPDTVALDEPIAPAKFADLLPDYEAVSSGVERFYRRMRRMALEEGVVLSKHIDGRVPDNTFGEERSDTGGLRTRKVSKGKIVIGKALSPDFTLVIKDPPMFGAILPTLAKRLPTYAIVRNPLSVLASWSSLNMPSREGRFPTAERYDPNLTTGLHAAGDRMERQLLMLDWWCERFYRNLSAEAIIRYEDVVASGGAALSAIVPSARILDERLENKNLNEYYNRDEMRQFGRRLLESEGAYWRFYTRQGVNELLAQLD